MCGILSQSEYEELAKQPEFGWTIEGRFVGKHGKHGMVVKHTSTLPANSYLGTSARTFIRVYAIMSRDGRDFQGFGDNVQDAVSYMGQQGFKPAADQQPIAEVSKAQTTYDQQAVELERTMFDEPVTEAEEEAVLATL